MLSEFGPVDYNKVKEDLRTDKFFQNQSYSSQLIILSRLARNDCNPHVVDGVWYGEIKHCPTCKKTRITSCCACGCGNCYTCGYTFSCLPQTLPVAFNAAPNNERTDFQKLETKIDNLDKKLDRILEQIKITRTALMNW